MGAFVMAAALNPNISNAELLKLIKADGDKNVKLIETFGECLGKCESNEQRIRYFNACFPVLLYMIF